MVCRHLGKTDFCFSWSAPLNYLHKECLNEPKHPVFIHAPPWSAFSTHAKFVAARFHDFGVACRRRTDGHTQTLTFIIIDFIYYIFYRGWPDIKSFIENKCRSPSTKQKGNYWNELSGKSKTWTQALSSFMTFGGKVYAGESPEQVFLPICLLRGTENNLSKKTVSCRINNVEWVQVYYCLNQRM